MSTSATHDASHPAWKRENELQQAQSELEATDCPPEKVQAFNREPLEGGLWLPLEMNHG